MAKTNINEGLSRRAFLKASGAVSAGIGLAGIAGAGYVAGKDYESYTGWERYHHGEGQFFKRKAFQKDRPTYGVEGPTRRLGFAENLFNRIGTIRALLAPADGSPPLWTPDKGAQGLPEPLKSYYSSHQESFKMALQAFTLLKQQKINWEKYKVQFAIADAWSNAHGSPFEDSEGTPHNPASLFPPEPDSPPEVWDYRGIRRSEPLPFKSPDHAATLIKKIAHTFGATLVGITELNPDWCYQGILRGVGRKNYDPPAHWKYAIVVATPHQWDQVYVNPVYGTSYDAYSRERIIAGKLEVFLHELGYPARSHVPPFFYDVVTPPIAVDAGLGEQGRNGLMIAPELGCNARLACVTTNVPMTVDKPIDIGVQSFCRKCKICAEQCPSGAISFKDKAETVVRGYRRWVINDDACFNVWASVATSHIRGCRVCIAVCPYVRKNNWMHTIIRQTDPRDPTGLVSSSALWMQKKLFTFPKAQDYLPPPDGKNATYGEPPDWLQTEKWFKVSKTW